MVIPTDMTDIVCGLVGEHNDSPLRKNDSPNHHQTNATSMEYKSTTPDLRARYDKVIVCKTRLVPAEHNKYKCLLEQVVLPPFETMHNHFIGELPVDPNGLRIDATMTRPKSTYPTLHTYGFVGMFKPDLAEILSQLPADVFDAKHVILTIQYALHKEAGDVLKCDKPYYTSGFHGGLVQIHELV
jgi:hypothetical protein